MLQRTPSYILSLPGRDPLAAVAAQQAAGEGRLSDRAVEERAALDRAVPVQPPPPGGRAEADPPAHRRSSCRRASTSTRTSTRRTTRGTSGCAWCPTATCSAPCAAATASIATGRIAHVHREGHRSSSPGEHLDADVIVTATGLNLLPMGGMSLSLDGEPVDVSETVSYKGMMISGVPNFTMVIGYTNASWTLKADLVNRYVCRLLNHLDAEGYASATPVAPPEGADLPFLDLASGYVQRSLDNLPKQGSRTPWRLHQNYIRDVQLMRRGSAGGRGHDLPARAPRPRPSRRSPDGRLPRSPAAPPSSPARPAASARRWPRSSPPAAATSSWSTGTRSGWTASPTACGATTRSSPSTPTSSTSSDDAATARLAADAGRRAPGDDAAGQQRRRGPRRPVRPGDPRGVRLGHGGQLPLRRPADPRASCRR